ncbi:hypothetical protein BYT27DRAFT_7245138 [Phlegmacium glaucopus]|nr:hypothetical protein BYT27DRAFT_7245138 [Phlegmacium glaucopus]
MGFTALLNSIRGDEQRKAPIPGGSRSADGGPFILRLRSFAKFRNQPAAFLIGWIQEWVPNMFPVDYLAIGQRMDSEVDGYIVLFEMILSMICIKNFIRFKFCKKISNRFRLKRKSYIVTKPDAEIPLPPLIISFPREGYTRISFSVYRVTGKPSFNLPVSPVPPTVLTIMGCTPLLNPIRKALPVQEEWSADGDPSILRLRDQPAPPLIGWNPRVNPEYVPSGLLDDRAENELQVSTVSSLLYFGLSDLLNLIKSTILEWSQWTKHMDDLKKLGAWRLINKEGENIPWPMLHREAAVKTWLLKPAAEEAVLIEWSPV